MQFNSLSIYFFIAHYTSDISKDQEGRVQFLLPNLGHYFSGGQTSGGTNVTVLTKQEVFCRIDAKTSMAQILR